MSARRMVRAVFWLRWLFLLSTTLLVIAGDETLLGDAVDNHDQLPICLAVAVAGNLVLRILLAVPIISDRVIGVGGVLLDSAVAALFFWAYDGAVAPFLIMGTLAVISASFRFGWVGVALAVALLATISGLEVIELDLDDSQLTNLGLSLVLLTLFGGTIAAVQGHSFSLPKRHSRDDPRVAAAARLRAARERARAISEMATSVGASLDHRRVLEEAQRIGRLTLAEDLGPGVHLINAVLLFQGKENRLRIMADSGMTWADKARELPGRKGVLGLALKQGEPVFAPDAARDPELRYFASFQHARSVLVIPLRAGFHNFGVMLFGCDAPNAFTNEHEELLAAIGTQATLALQNAVLYQNLAEEKERIVEVEEDARKKLARDLHDGPTQSVAAIAMRVNYIRRLIERQPQQALEELWKVEDLARRTTKEIRHMLFTLRPLVLETQGLIAALDQLADKMQETHDQHVEIQAQPEAETLLDKNAQGVLFYIIEEAVNNARKHAEADTIWARLYRRGAYMVVEIEDHGKGFDLESVTGNYETRGSLGMINMRERAELVEGTLHMQSTPGKGTKITILVPLDPATAESEDGSQDRPPPLHLQTQHGKPAADATEAPPRQPPPKSRPSAPDTQSLRAAALGADTAPDAGAPSGSGSNGTKDTGQPARPPDRRLRRPGRPRRPVTNPVDTPD